jgi:hypothetical protein
MGAGPFVWKQALLAPKIRVELSDDAISVETTKTSRTIQLRDITNVYYNRNYMSHTFLGRLYLTPHIHSLYIQIDAKNGGKADFSASGYGRPDGYDAQECRKATIAFLSHLERVIPNAQVYEGVRPSRRMNLFMLGIIGFALAYTAYQMLRYYPLEKLAYTLAVIGFGVITVGLFSWRLLRKINNLKLISASSAREALELIDQSG